VKPINFDKETKLYSLTFDVSYVQSECLKLCESLFEKSKLNITDAFPYKIDIKINEEWIESQLDVLIDIAITNTIELYKEKNINFNNIFIDTWVNVVRKGKPKQPIYENKNEITFHSHAELNAKRKTFNPDYTFIIYLQMPNNLDNDDGVLFIKGMDGKIYSYLPNEGEIVIMSGDTYHVPNSAPNSTKDRIVIAGNVGFELNKKIVHLI
jgi:hypothetical protein